MRSHVNIPQTACVSLEVARRRKKLLCQGAGESFAEAVGGRVYTAGAARPLTVASRKAVPEFRF